MISVNGQVVSYKSNVRSAEHVASLEKLSSQNWEIVYRYVVTTTQVLC